MAVIDEQREEAHWAKAGNAELGGNKSVGRSKASLFSLSPKLPGLARGFPGLHRHLEQHLQHLPWTPSGTGPRRYPLAQSPFWLCAPLPQTTPNQHCQSHTTGTKPPFLLQLFWLMIFLQLKKPT